MLSHSRRALLLLRTKTQNTLVTFRRPDRPKALITKHKTQFISNSASSRLFCSVPRKYGLSFGSNVVIPVHSSSEGTLTLPPVYYPQFDSLYLKSQDALQVLRWLAQKDQLGQDCVLLGPPGPIRRRLALYYCSLANRQYEMISLTRDINESDLTLRREISEKRTVWSDRVAVKAALEGKILIIDGLEKAERGILPILNNLLENREMNLEDGRFLMSSKRFDNLISSGVYTKEDLDKLKILRVHEDFRVVALAMPTPRYPGNPLDPPLRSRLQSILIPTSLESDLQSIEQWKIPNDTINDGSSIVNQQNHAVKDLAVVIASIVHSIFSAQKIGSESFKDLIGSQYQNNDVPQTALPTIIQALETFGTNINLADLLFRCYPVQLLDLNGKKGLKSRIESLLAKFKLFPSTLKESTKKSSILENHSNLQSFQVADIHQSPQSDLFSADVQQKESLNDYLRNVHFKNINFKYFDSEISIHVPSGNKPSMSTYPLIMNDQRSSILFGMLQDHAIGRDIALVGPKGCGKSSIVNYFASILGYSVETILLYKDMNCRDLLQRRSTDSETGDTVWVNSGLVNAALEGKLVILDKIERLSPDGLASLQSLLHDRRIQLPDGTRLVHHQEYFNLSQEEQKSYKPIHPSFRVVAIGNSTKQTSTHTGSSDKSSFINEETMTLFQYSVIDPPTEEQEEQLLLALVPNPSLSSTEWNHVVQKMIRFSSLLRSNSTFGGASSWSLRQSIRTLQKIAFNIKKPFDPVKADTLMRSYVQDEVLSKFLPSHAKQVLNDILNTTPLLESNQDTLDSIGVNQQEASEALDRYMNQKDAVLSDHLVPQIEFFDNPQHSKLLAQMKIDFELGYHLLLIGNQGTGKNKLTDHFLEISNLRRQYLQLHRDTTISSLTTQPAIKNDRIVYEDSPLVKAVINGHVLVLDEVDKAEVEVVSILNNLIDGEMMLADGRRIVSQSKLHLYSTQNDSKTIVIHPNFRMIVLANRPGWPFLGNDFFKECGDLFSTLQISNPDLESELALLQQFGPSVPKDKLLQLAKAFSELRQLHDQGNITYPYSTRECVSVVKHMQQYPEDSFSLALGNVFSYDVFNEHTKKLVRQVFEKYGMISSGEWFLESDKLVGTKEKIQMQLLMSDQKKEASGMPKHGKIDPSNCPHVGGNKWAGGTGGSMTAGLGGKGGPYRYDAGHQVHQLSDQEKANVSQTIKDAAKRMAEEALSKRLKEIDMHIEDAKMYEQIHQRVKDQVSQLRVILEALRTKSSPERQWMRNQQDGEMDESKVVDAIIGDRAIYKKRMIPVNSNPLAPMKKPKMIRFVVDISGSMYRFNSTDSRLDRILEITTMIMEAFEGFEEKIQYSIVGHSGDSDEVRLVNFGKPPQNRNDRYKILQKMIAHTQFCSSGDNTVEATQKAVQSTATIEGDENFVFVFSDANLDRYGIPVKALANAMVTPSMNDSKSVVSEVQCHAIFIASLFRGQTASLVRQLPLGSAHVCLDTSDLPSLFNKLLSSTALKL